MYIPGHITRLQSFDFRECFDLCFFCKYLNGSDILITLLLFSLGTQLSIPMEFGLPWSQTKLEIYNINANKDSDQVALILDKHSNPRQTSDLFIVVCSTRCIEDVLQKVNSKQIKLNILHFIVCFLI